MLSSALFFCREFTFIGNFVYTECIQEEFRAVSFFVSIL